MPNVILIIGSAMILENYFLENKSNLTNDFHLQVFQIERVYVYFQFESNHVVQPSGYTDTNTLLMAVSLLSNSLSFFSSSHWYVTVLISDCELYKMM